MKMLRDKRLKRWTALAVAAMLLTSLAGCGGCAGCNTNITPVTATPTVTVTATVAPTEEVVPTVAPTMTVAPTDVPEVEPTEVPVITEEATPTVEVVPTETPAATATPIPEPTAAVALTATPEPTPTCTPEPTATPVPTATPKPTATTKPTATPIPTPTPEVVNGIKAGDYVTFGSYEQDANLGNGKEPIEWLVLEVKDGKAFLLSKYVLDAQPYDSNFDEDAWLQMAWGGEEYDYHATWEKSTLRSWLNGEFYNTAFNATEKNGILLSKVENLPNSLRGTSSGPDTKDRIYLLNEDEAVKYLGEEPLFRRIPKEHPAETLHLGVPTEYALAQGVGVLPSEATYWYKMYCDWTLRTTGAFESRNTYISEAGFLDQEGSFVDARNDGIRPCLWIDVSTAEVKKVY